MGSAGRSRRTRPRRPVGAETTYSVTYVNGIIARVAGGRTSRRRYERAVLSRPVRRLRDLAPEPPPPSCRPGRTVSCECAGRPPPAREQALEPGLARNRASPSPHRRSSAARRRNWDRCAVLYVSNPLWAGVPAMGAAPASALRARLPRRRPAMPAPAVPPGRSPASLRLRHHLAASTLRILSTLRRARMFGVH